MRGGRAKLPVLAEVSGPAPEEPRVWSLRREDLTQLAGVQERLAERRAVLVTGAPEPSRIVAVAVAGAASAAGRRTVLLDCDLAEPRLAADLGLARAPGLHEYLRWEATAPQLLQPLVLAGPAAAAATEPLVFIAAGRPAPEPGTLLGLQSFRHMASKLRHAYDLVVFGGPALSADEAPLRAIAEEADSLLAGLPPGQASGRAGRATRAALRRLPVPPLGAVVVEEG